MIEGVQIISLRRIPDERGTIMHMLRADAPHFQGFGEIYFSTVFPGVIKGWHRHSVMTLNYAVPVGMIKLVLYDSRMASTTQGEVQEIVMGEDNYLLVSVPPGVWNGFKGIGVATAVVANCATHPHDPLEIERADPLNNDIPYDWSLRHQ
ncbi:MAG: dTDP-4-dehydrorhamnose 3,5-epimerase family protein [Herpetosiphonaceae bacterium]|nr:dTDP-4-dehydrorhamnose 3,5-epimerase family protein [Herpetosiphonaceae bacterium]